MLYDSTIPTVRGYPLENWSIQHFNGYGFPCLLDTVLLLKANKVAMMGRKRNAIIDSCKLSSGEQISNDEDIPLIHWKTMQAEEFKKTLVLYSNEISYKEIKNKVLMLKLC